MTDRRSAEPSDAELIDASLNDPAAFELIYRRHSRAVFRFVARRVGPEDAADLTADTFVRAIEIRHRYHLDQPSCLPWLYGIAQNIVGDRLRRVRRRDRIYLAASTDSLTLDFGEDADNRIEAAALTDRLNFALGALSPRDRNTLLLHALEGLSYAEIATALDIPPGTVASRLNRARHQIRELIPPLDQIPGWSE